MQTFSPLVWLLFAGVGATLVIGVGHTLAVWLAHEADLRQLRIDARRLRDEYTKRVAAMREGERYARPGALGAFDAAGDVDILDDETGEPIELAGAIEVDQVNHAEQAPQRQAA